MGLSYNARFWLYLLPLVPSVLCSIFVLYHFLAQRALRTAISNHVLILMLSFGLLFELTDIVWLIHFYRTGTSLLSTPHFCLSWLFIDASVNTNIPMLMAWASIERYILTFHHTWILGTTKCFFLHYLPLIVCSVYPAVFYGIMFFILPCDVPFNYSMLTCNYYSCILKNPSAALYDSVMHYLLPISIIVIFSVVLLVRVLLHRSLACGRIQWRNYRKMAVQLLSISGIYVVFSLPPILLYTAHTAGVPWIVASDFFDITMYFVYYTELLTPFVCAASLPELRLKCKQLCVFRRRNAVVPILNPSALIPVRR